MIPVNEPQIGKEEKKYVEDCLASGWISSEGPFKKKFEDNFASHLGLSAGIALSNGTAAIETALYAVGIKEGDEVILPSFTIISCLLAVIRIGAVPILVDIEADTWCMSVSDVETKITKKTKAILVVHTYGHPVDMDPILEISKNYDICIIEDVAEAHGAEYKGKKCGTFGSAATFSFYANKFVTTGEGGMVVTNDPKVEQRARNYINLCFNKNERFLHDDIGYNFRMTSLQAALGLGQLERIESTIEKKIKMGQFYKSCLSNMDGIQLQIEKPWAKTVYWMYGIQISEKYGVTAKDIMGELKKIGIGTRPFFRGLHDQPAIFRKGIIKTKDSYPVSDKAYKYGFYLPSSLNLSTKQITHICDAVKKILITRS